MTLAQAAEKARPYQEFGRLDDRYKILRLDGKGVLQSWLGNDPKLTVDDLVYDGWGLR